jgi:hypothetical protein
MSAPPPAIDRLVIVAYGGECGARSGQELEQFVLAGVGVLVLIDQQITQAILPFVAHSRLALEKRHGQGDQIIEVDRLISLQGGRITRERVCRESFGFVPGVSPCFVRRDQGAFPV